MPRGVYDRKQTEEAPKEVEMGMVKPDVAEVKVSVSSKLPPLPKGIEARIEDGRYVMSDDGHPLCKECNHRQDMHHVWREVEHQGFERDMYGNKRETTWITKHKNFETPSNPCQHACKCWNYK